MTLRSHLYVPADQERLVLRAETRGADAIILDLEDSVSENRKDVALADTLAFLATPRQAGERWVRVNTGERGLDEIRALAATRVDGVWMPKVEPDAWFSTALGLIINAEMRLGILIESAAGLAGMPSLPALPANAIAQLGEIDLAASLRMRDSTDEAMSPYRARMVMECAIRGMAAPVAPVDPRIDGSETYRVATTSLRDRGFGSRACIHPSQVAIANEVFSISDSDIEQARAMIRDFEDNTEAGRGAYSGADGRMVDLATVRWARATIASSPDLT